MLGLGSLLSAAASLRTEVKRLFSKLRGRSEYYENNRDSQASVVDTFNYGLLDKATILLTPTATSDALVHSVKTYTGDELVVDNDFPNFDNWNNGTGWTVSNGKAVHTKSVGAGGLYQELNLQVGNKYLFKAKIDATLESGLGNTAMQIRNNANSNSFVQLLSAQGAILPGVVNDLQLVFTATVANSLARFYSMDDISVYDVSITDISSDFTFDRASSATRINSDGLVQDMQSITDPELVKNGDFSQIGSEDVNNGDFATDSDWIKGGSWTYDSLNQSYKTTNNSISSLKQDGITETGKTYKLTFNVTSAPNGFSGFRIVNSAWSDVYVDANEAQLGENTFYINVVNGTGIRFRVDDPYEIDNISVKEVGQDWDFGGGWTMGDNIVTTIGEGNYFKQTNLSPTGTTALYKVVWTQEITNGTRLRFFARNYNDGSNVTILSGSATGSGNFTAANGNCTGSGTYTVFVSTTDGYSFKLLSESGNSATVDNVSVKDVTFSEDVDLARINYDGSGQNGHILLEPTSTNLIIYSEDFSKSNWSKQSNITPTYNTTETLSPDGTYNATKFVGNGNDGVFIQVTVTGVVTRSVYLKSVTGTVNVLLKDPVLTQTTKTLTLNETWQRYDLSESNQHGSTSGLWVDDIPSSGIYMWGAQLEALPYATSYIPTLVGNTVTRAAETLNNSGNTTLINSTEGVLFAEIAALANDGTNRPISISDGSTSDVVRFYYSSTGDRIVGSVKSGSSSVFFYNHVLSNATDFIKVAISYKANDFKMYVDGTQVSTDTSGATPIGLKELAFDNGSGSDDFYGKVKQLAVFNEALEDDELELLTGITNFSSFSATASGGGYTVI